MTQKIDEYDGQGGSYVIDKDGNRVLVHRTEEKQIDISVSAEYTNETPKTKEVKNAKAD